MGTGWSDGQRLAEEATGAGSDPPALSVQQARGLFTLSSSNDHGRPLTHHEWQRVAALPEVARLLRLAAELQSVTDASVRRFSHTKLEWFATWVRENVHIHPFDDKLLQEIARQASRVCTNCLRRCACPMFKFSLYSP